MAQAGAVWPPPSTAQSPVYEFRFTKAMVRSGTILFHIYQYYPNFWGRKLEVSENGFSGLCSRYDVSCIPWPDIETVTLARRRNQVCIAYGRSTFGFKAKLAQIFTVSQENYDLFGVVLKRYARCPVVENETIYWSYSKLMFWFSLFWLCELSLVFRNHHSQWAAYWKQALVSLNHLVSLNLP